MKIFAKGVTKQLNTSYTSKTIQIQILVDGFIYILYVYNFSIVLSLDCFHSLCGISYLQYKIQFVYHSIQKLLKLLKVTYRLDFPNLIIFSLI